MEFPGGQTLRHTDFARDEAISCDAVIVGAGAGGAAAAAVLSEKGLRVLLLEEGRKFEPEELISKPSWAYRNLYAERSTRFMHGNLYIPLSGGRAVGGSTLLNSAICFRTPGPVLKKWREGWGLPWADPAQLEPTFKAIEQAIGVSKTHPTQARKNSLMFKEAAGKLGLFGDFISRNAPGCIGCGLCQVGCPVGGKGSVDRNLIPTAQGHGAGLITCARVAGVRVEKGAARGVDVEILDPASEKPLHKLRVDAQKVFLSAGAIGTPMLLLRQGLANSSGQVGKNLHVHPATGMCARFDEVVDAWDGATQGYYVQLEDCMLETFSASPDLYFTQYSEFASSLETLRHIASCGVIIGDESAGEVRPGDTPGRSRIRYELADVDKKKIVHGLQTMARAYFAIGAREVHPGIYGVGTARSEAELLAKCHDRVPIQEFSIYASHPMGTCRMGDERENAVVKPTGETWDVANLYIADASLFPTSLGVNPQITVMTVSTLVARQAV